MSTFSIQIIDYIKPYLQYEETRLKVYASLGSFVKKLLVPLERAATIAVVLLIASLVILVFMKLGEVGAATEYFCNACNGLPPMFLVPQ